MRQRSACLLTFIFKYKNMAEPLIFMQIFYSRLKHSDCILDLVYCLVLYFSVMIRCLYDNFMRPKISHHIVKPVPLLYELFIYTACGEFIRDDSHAPARFVWFCIRRSQTRYFRRRHLFLAGTERAFTDIFFCLLFLLHKYIGTFTAFRSNNHPPA